MKYHQHIDGEDELIEMKTYPTHKIACCDCGLVHVLEFKKVSGSLLMKAKIDNRATGQKRRYMQTSNSTMYGREG